MVLLVEAMINLVQSVNALYSEGEKRFALTEPFLKI